MYKKNNYNRPKNKTFKIPVFDKGKTFKSEYDFSKLQDVMNGIENSIFRIPVYMPNSIVFSNPDKKGITPIGYIKSYSKEANEAEIVVNARNVKAAESLGTSAVVFVRLAVSEDGEIVRVLGVDLNTEEAYENL